MGRGRAVPVQTAVATPIASGGEPGSAGASVTANGYVVARTRASVAAKLAGRIADLRVSEGSNLKKGEIIATLDNDDYRAQAAQTEAALPINRIVTSTTNWASFSEIAFSFRVTPGLLLAGICFALVMGLVGGFFPAWRAARLPVVQALR